MFHCNTVSKILKHKIIITKLLIIMNEYRSLNVMNEYGLSIVMKKIIEIKHSRENSMVSLFWALDAVLYITREKLRKGTQAIS